MSNSVDDESQRYTADTELPTVGKAKIWSESGLIEELSNAAEVVEDDDTIFSDTTGTTLEINTDLDFEEGDELVRRSDAEEKIAEERSRIFEEGFFEGRQSREEEILERMSEIASENWGGKQEATKQDWKNAWQTLCKELEASVEKKTDEVEE